MLDENTTKKFETEGDASQKKEERKEDSSGILQVLRTIGYLPSAKSMPVAQCLAAAAGVTEKGDATSEAMMYVHLMEEELKKRKQEMEQQTEGPAPSSDDDGSSGKVKVSVGKLADRLKLQGAALANFINKAKAQILAITNKNIAQGTFTTLFMAITLQHEAGGEKGVLAEGREQAYDDWLAVTKIIKSTFNELKSQGDETAKEGMCAMQKAYDEFRETTYKAIDTARKKGRDVLDKECADQIVGALGTLKQEMIKIRHRFLSRERLPGAGEPATRMAGKEMPRSIMGEPDL